MASNNMSCVNFSLPLTGRSSSVSSTDTCVMIGTTPVQTTPTARVVTPFPDLGYTSESMMTYSKQESAGDADDEGSACESDSGSEYSQYSPSLSDFESDADTATPQSQGDISPGRYVHRARPDLSNADASDIRLILNKGIENMKVQLSRSNPIVHFQGGSPVWSEFPSYQVSGSAMPALRVVNSDAEDSPSPVYQNSAYDDVFANFSADYSCRSGQTDLDILDLVDLTTPTDDEIFGLSTPTPEAGVCQPQLDSQGDVEMLDVSDDTAFDAFLADLTNEVADGNSDLDSFMEGSNHMSESFIQPYDLPSNVGNAVCSNLPQHHVDYDFAAYTLANSGVNVVTEFPLSTSPRMDARTIRSTLKGYSKWYRDSKEVGFAIQPRDFVAVSRRWVCFEQFSYTNSWQPTSMITKELEGVPLSPKSMPSAYW